MEIERRVREKRSGALEECCAGKPYKNQFYTLLRENLGLCVVSCGAERCISEHSWGPGQRDFYLLHVVKNGAGYFEQAGVSYTVAAGQAFLAYPGETVSYHAERADPWEYAWTGFAGADAGRLAEECGFDRKSAVVDVSEAGVLFEQIGAIYTERGGTAASELRMCGELLRIFAALSNGKHVSLGSLREDCAAKAARYIEKNFCNDIRVEDIAAALGISRSQLFRVFKQRYELSLCRFLTKYRINMAAALLKQGNLSVGEAAFSVGFFDQLYFSRVFKKEKGMTPSEYIRSSRKKQ